MRAVKLRYCIYQLKMDSSVTFLDPFPPVLFFPQYIFICTQYRLDSFLKNYIKKCEGGALPIT